MIKNVKIKNDYEKIINMSEMKQLDIGIIVDSEQEQYNHIVMRTASSNFEVMDLSCPGNDMCWTTKNDIRVQLFKSGTIITLEVK